ncbi:MAG: outer membrane lipoprotein-sorting protein [Campylobacterales bacterium]|nr:outer membrane lipoprotein-sorting protein [Campylobacterales bacterium]
MRILSLILCCFAALYGLDAAGIIAKVEENLRGEQVYLRMSMRIVTQRHERTLQLESWSQGKKRSFVRINHPPMERGITFLNLEGQMWQYVPRIERTIKIPPSMMLQSWMGSDISNDDIVRQSSLTEDYDARIVEHNGSVALIELIPKPDASVVWGKVLSRIDTERFVALEERFYDEEGTLVRTFSFDAVKRFGRYHLPTRWEIRPQAYPHNRTTLLLEEVDYDTPIDEAYFTKSALTRFAR